MNKTPQKKDEQTVYWINPKSPPDPIAKVYCENDTCANFIPVHQTCNLKNIFINAKGKCEFSVKRKASTVNTNEK